MQLGKIPSSRYTNLTLGLVEDKHFAPVTNIGNDARITGIILESRDLHVNERKL